jgi:hypothetical protein
LSHILKYIFDKLQGIFSMVKEIKGGKNPPQITEKPKIRQKRPKWIPPSDICPNPKNKEGWICPNCKKVWSPKFFGPCPCSKISKDLPDCWWDVTV